MAKIILMCGKICSGKTSYSKKLAKETGAVRFSSDEMLSAIFNPNENEYHDKYIDNIRNYLAQKAVEVATAGAVVILDWGFWTKTSREDIVTLLKSHNIDYEWHYMDICEASWKRNIMARNTAVKNKQTTDFFVDDALLDKLNSLFEPPTKSEIDVWNKV